MYDAIRTHIETIAAAMNRGDARSLTCASARNLPVFYPGGVFLLEGKAAQRSAFLHHREQLDRLGLRRIEAQVAAVGLSRGPLVRVFIDWTHHMGPDQPARQERNIFYMRHSRAPGGFSLENIAFRTLAFPECVGWHRRFLVGALPRTQETPAGKALREG